VQDRETAEFERDYHEQRAHAVKCKTDENQQQITSPEIFQKYCPNEVHRADSTIIIMPYLFFWSDFTTLLIKRPLVVRRRGSGILCNEESIAR
jgi:hypothetical protein